MRIDLNHYLTYSEMILATSNYWNISHGRAPGEVLQARHGATWVKTHASYGDRICFEVRPPLVDVEGQDAGRQGDRGAPNPSTGCLRQPAAGWPTRATPARSLWSEALQADPHVPAAEVKPFRHDDPDPGEPPCAADPAAEAAVQPCGTSAGRTAGACLRRPLAHEAGGRAGRAGGWTARRA